MGKIISTLWDGVEEMLYPCNRPEVKVMVFGLQGGGKTTILHTLKTGMEIETLPTEAFNVEKVNFQGILDFVMWDMGGGPTGESVYRHYLFKTEAFIFVVDSSNKKTICDAKIQLHQRYRECVRMIGKPLPLLILANKQDKSNAMQPLDIAKALDLESLKKVKALAVLPVSGTTGDGLEEALLWLFSAMYDEYEVKLQEADAAEKTGIWNYSFSGSAEHDFVKRQLELPCLRESSTFPLSSEHRLPPGLMWSTEKKTYTDITNVRDLLKAHVAKNKTAPGSGLSRENKRSRKPRMKKPRSNRNSVDQMSTIVEEAAKGVDDTGNQGTEIKRTVVEEKNKNGNFDEMGAALIHFRNENRLSSPNAPVSIRDTNNHGGVVFDYFSDQRQ